MFRFIKKCFFKVMMFFSCNVMNVIPLKCVSINNQEFRVRSEIININSNEPSFYPCSIKVNKCSGSLIMLMIHMQRCC